MADLQALFQAVDKLSAEEIEELYKHVAEIRTQHEHAITVVSQPRERVFDLYAGRIWVSDDFDDELPDEFWLGQES
jgi:hypothetical protein